MPANDAASALGQASTRLLDRVVRNKDLTNFFKGFLGRVADRASELRAGMEGIRAGTVTMTENRIKCPVSFIGLILPASGTMSISAQCLTDHIGKENELFYALIRANPSIAEMLVQVIEKMDAYARDKGRDFAGLEFLPIIMDEQNNFILPIQPETWRG